MPEKYVWLQSANVEHGPHTPVMQACPALHTPPPVQSLFVLQAGAQLGCERTRPPPNDDSEKAARPGRRAAP